MNVKEPTAIRLLAELVHNGMALPPGSRLTLPRNLAIWLVETKKAELDRLAIPTSAMVAPQRAALLSRPRRGCCGR